MSKIRHLLFGLILATSTSSIIGCAYFPESTFSLASDSRLPKWITLTPGISRTDVSLTMNYYMKPWGRTAKFILQDTKKQTIKEAYGELKCKEPFQLKNPPPGFPAGYPAYEAITVNGVSEIIEHRKMEPIFYVTDDASARKEYEAVGCR